MIPLGRVVWAAAVAANRIASAAWPRAALARILRFSVLVFSLLLTDAHSVIENRRCRTQWAAVIVEELPRAYAVVFLAVMAQGVRQVDCAETVWGGPGTISPEPRDQAERAVSEFRPSPPRRAFEERRNQVRLAATDKRSVPP